MISGIFRIVFALLFFGALLVLFFFDLNQLLHYAPLATFTLGCCAFAFALRTYRRKSDISVKSSYIKNPSSHYGKTYIQSYTLESDKDKAIVIFRTYLKIGFDTYLLLEDFKNEPHILKAYEVHHKEFPKSHWFTSNEDKVDLTNILNDPKIEKNIVLSTSHGKYITKAIKKPWYAETSKFNYNFIGNVHDKNFLKQGYAKLKEQNFISLTDQEVSKSFMVYSYRKIIACIKTKGSNTKEYLKKFNKRK